MKYTDILLIITLVTIINIPLFTIHVFGQTTDAIARGNLTSNNTVLQLQPTEQLNHSSNPETIKISSTDLNKLVNAINDSINLIRNNDNDAAISKLGLTVIELLNSTNQYQELVQFASSQLRDFQTLQDLED